MGEDFFELMNDIKFESAWANINYIPIWKPLSG